MLGQIRRAYTRNLDVYWAFGGLAGGAAGTIYGCYQWGRSDPRYTENPMLYAALGALVGGTLPYAPYWGLLAAPCWGAFALGEFFRELDKGDKKRD